MNSVRASVSAASKNSPPASALKGSSDRWSAPVSERTACGAMSPTKPITPLTDTAAAGSSVATPSANSRTTGALTPSVRASASADSAFRSRATHSEAASPRAVAAATGRSFGKLADAKLPIVQR